MNEQLGIICLTKRQSEQLMWLFGQDIGYKYVRLQYNDFL